MVQRNSKTKKNKSSQSLKDLIDSLPPKTHDKPKALHEVRRTSEFSNWLQGIKDPMTKARLLRRIEKAETDGHFGKAEPVGNGISEMKIDFGPGYRIYFTELNGVTYLLLLGGDKSTQQQDIKDAKIILDREKLSST